MQNENMKGEREYVIESLGAFSFHILEEPFHLANP